MTEIGPPVALVTVSVWGQQVGVNQFRDQGVIPTVQSVGWKKCVAIQRATFLPSLAPWTSAVRKWMPWSRRGRRWCRRPQSVNRAGSARRHVGHGGLDGLDDG